MAAEADRRRLSAAGDLSRRSAKQRRRWGPPAASDGGAWSWVSRAAWLPDAPRGWRRRSCAVGRSRLLRELEAGGRPAGRPGGRGSV